MERLPIQYLCIRRVFLHKIFVRYPREPMELCVGLRYRLRLFLEGGFWARYTLINPFRTAVPCWGHTTQTSSSLSPKRDCSPEMNSMDLAQRGRSFFGAIDGFLDNKRWGCQSRTIYIFGRHLTRYFRKRRVRYLFSNIRNLPSLGSGKIERWEKKFTSDALYYGSIRFLLLQISNITQPWWMTRNRENRGRESALKKCFKKQEVKSSSGLEFSPDGKPKGC